MFYDDGRTGPVRCLYDFFKSSIQVQISNLQCNIANGAWTATEAGNKVVVPKDSNVNCHPGCDYEPYYVDPEYCGVDNHCETVGEIILSYHLEVL